jgi:hypothetical protein
MPFPETIPATGACGVLGNENRESAHGSLFAVIFRQSGSESGADDLFRLSGNGMPSFERNQFSVFLFKLEAGTEF